RRISRKSSRSPFTPALVSLQASVLGRRTQEAAQGGVEVRFVEEEGVMALVRLDLGEARPATGGVQRADDVAALAGGIEPVGREGEHAEPDVARLAEGLRQHPAAAARRQ